MKVKFRKDGTIDPRLTKFDHFIVIGESGTPMCWIDKGEQLYYCNAKQPVTVYPSKELAKVYIKKSITWRKENGYTVGQYDVIPLNI